MGDILFMTNKINIDTSVVIIGASGFLGSKLFSEIKYSNIIGTYMSHVCDGAVYLDVTDNRNVASFFRKYNPEIVVCTYGMTSTDVCETNHHRAFLINVEGIKNVIEHFTGKIIYFSSDYVFDGTSKDGYTESSEKNPVNYYGYTKSMAEEMVLESSSNLIVRVSGLYGFSARNTFYERLLHSKEIEVRVDLFSSNLLIDDVVENFQDLVHFSGIVHMSDCENISRYDFIARATSVLSINTRIIPIESDAPGIIAKRPKHNQLKTLRTFSKPIHGSTEGLEYMKVQLRLMQSEL
jgi:dTDP-4-dehydrorhamnose reductase